MNKLEFWCPKDGRAFGNCVMLLIDEECCGTKQEIIYKGHQHSESIIGSICPKHNTFEKIWNKYVLGEVVLTTKVVTVSGCRCISCGEYNEYAVRNWGDKFKCYSCRSYESL